MRRTSMMLAVAVAIGVASSAMAGEAKKVKPTKMTCEEFLALSDQLQPRAVAFLDGYSKSGTLKEQDIGEVDVDRQMAVLVVSCKEDPKKTLWEKIRGHLPGGNKKVKPAKMTCQDFVDLDETIKPEAVYWAEGYNKAGKVKEDDVGEIDLDRDVAVIVQMCKEAPKESFWSKVKKHLHL